MTKKLLNQYLYLRKEINCLQSELISLTLAAVEKEPAAQKQVREILLMRRMDCAVTLGNLEHFISSIDDSRMRLIFTLRYRRGFSWQKIAFALGETDESYPRRIHDRYLRQEAAENAEHSLVS